MLNFFQKTQGSSTEEEKNSVPVLAQDLYADKGLNLADIIAPSAVKVESKQLILGEKFVRSFFITSYPSVVTDNWLSPLINLDKVFDIAIYIHPVDTATIMKKFEKKVAEVQSQISVREGKGFVRDPMLESAYRDLEDLRDRLQQAQEKMFDVGLYLSLYADTEEELGHAEAEIKSMLESRLIYVRPALFQQEEAFQSIIPVNEDKIAVTKKINSEPLSSFFPFVSFDLTSDRGILYGINRHNSSLVLFDRFSLENYNSITFAKSGSGKSFFTKLEILRSLMFDIDVIVIDPEREYESMAEAVGGRYFNISLNSEHHINPFDLPVPREDESPADVLRANIISLVGLFRIMLSGLSPEEDAIIDRAIAETYALKDITPDSDFTAIEPPLLSDFEMVLSGMEGAENILTKLTKYTRGSWAGFINQPSNVDINRKFIVFSVRDMEDDLKPVAMYLVTHFIWNAIRRTLRKRLLVVDEAWWMMKSEDTAAFLYALAKRGRKYYLGISTITQDVNDFLKSPYGLPIMTNSSIQVLLKQSPTSIDSVQKAFNLTDEEKFLLLESGVGEGIFFAGMKHVAIRSIASYTEEQIITSDPGQILAIKKAKRELADAEAGV
ncbi:MAG: DUF87 domain-containing protein [bacterium]|nr:DUF87 domain-containing protein [bacterium]